MKKECTSKLQELTGKNHIVFVRRGNTAILAALKLLKSLRYENVLIQDQGGWLTYSKYIEKLKLNEVKLKTDYGLVSNIKEKDSCLLLTSMAGYFALQDMDNIQKIVKKNKLFLINDASGSIGTEHAKVGDVVFGSFGRWKPLNVEEGAFIATNEKKHYDFLKEFEVDINFEKLHDKLTNLKDKLLFYDMWRNKIINDLSEYDVIHRDKLGINVIVKFSSDSEKEKLIKYCNENNYEFVECPRYIRVLDNAISIEVKRLEL
ncbi:DegT/DnrJ/EryC1/StrS family aminotransferase [Candidatus Woesearchaeota archaeon]|nr:DegT/DnrJ/EryC1/StrS family aminotransferase [Candidatus Woesearchaeota archaeon]